MIKRKMLSIALISLTSMAINPAYANTPQQWIGAWAGVSQMLITEGISHEGLHKQTIRMIVHPHASGSELKIRLSNLYGKTPLVLDKVNVALSSKSGTIVVGSSKALMFGGKSHVSIPAGAEVVSDPLKFAVQDSKDLAISMYAPNQTGPLTYHSFAMQTSYITDGDHVSDSTLPSTTQKIDNWFILNGVDVLNHDKKPRVIVTFGDSITDGALSTPNANHRWSDYLFKRLKQTYPDRTISVINAGLSGNKILRDDPRFGEKALSRFNRDVLSQSGVSDIILLEGINDIGHEPHELSAEKITNGMKTLADEAHAKGLKIYIGTLTPFYKNTIKNYYTDEGEATRKAVNQWIHSNKVFDGVIDFEKAVANPNNPVSMLAKYDSGDHLHPKDAGYEAMANAINLSWFKPLK